MTEHLSFGIYDVLGVNSGAPVWDVDMVELARSEEDIGLRDAIFGKGITQAGISLHVRRYPWGHAI